MNKQLIEDVAALKATVESEKEHNKEFRQWVQGLVPKLIWSFLGFVCTLSMAAVGYHFNQKASQQEIADKISSEVQKTVVAMLGNHISKKPLLKLDINEKQKYKYNPTSDVLVREDIQSGDLFYQNGMPTAETFE
jgi:hypothetical protein